MHQKSKFKVYNYVAQQGFLGPKPNCIYQECQAETYLFSFKNLNSKHVCVEKSLIFI